MAKPIDRPIRRVIKLGGSLLVRSDLTTRWPDRIPLSVPDRQSETIVLVGGGQWVDAIRQLDRECSLDPVETHWRCIALLNHSYDSVHDRFPTWHPISDATQLERAIRGGFATDHPTLVSVHAFYDRNRQYGLPTDWSTTSDSLALVLANVVDADELVLLKSCFIDESWTLAELVDRGIVDQAFLQISPRPSQVRVETF